jgi:hypothetical protein
MEQGLSERTTMLRYTYIAYLVILSSHLCLALPGGLFPSVFPTERLYTILQYTLYDQSTERPPPTLNSARSKPLAVGAVHCKARSTLNWQNRNKTQTRCLATNLQQFRNIYEIHICVFCNSTESLRWSVKSKRFLFCCKFHCLQTGLSAEWTFRCLLRTRT